MCGITGLYAFNQIGSFYMINLAKSIDSLTHRGPDGRGTYISDFAVLGHRRLSIIDTETGLQPMQDITGRYHIVFNGEIFNYKKLKEELVQQYQVSFSTHSDTEVLLYAYIYWKENAFNKLSGFFSFAIYDSELHELIVVRDRMGVKPLYYYQDEDKFAFGSELKAILSYNIPKEIDQASLITYHTLGYIPSPDTIFSTVKKLEPGSYIKLSKDKVHTTKYYTFPTQEFKQQPNWDIAKSEVEKLLHLSIQDRLISDVPVGAFLSGGLDSSVIVSIAKEYENDLQTFTIGYENNSMYDESLLAEKVAKHFGTRHTTFRLSSRDIVDSLFYGLDALDEPFADSSSMAMFILTKQVKSHVKVALSGDGADELFGGYNKHRAEYWVNNTPLWMKGAMAIAPILQMFDIHRGSYWANKFRQVQRLREGMKLSPKERYYYWCSINHDSSKYLIQTEDIAKQEYLTRKDRFNSYINNGKYLNQVLYSDLKNVLEGDMLVKVDRMSMANSVEVREPMLDYRLIEYVNQLPSEFKVTAKENKSILRAAFKDKLPEAIMNAPKHGFEIPLMPIITGQMKKWVIDELLSDELIVQQGIYNPDYIRMLKHQLKEGKQLDQPHIWSIIVFQYWWKKWMK
ncbi:MAG: asparagine synthase (glutamine-hydrolyzing) [Cytophagaceae bacterium]